MIPKYIRDAVNARARAATKFNELDIMISQWCDRHCEQDAVEDTWGFVDTLNNPYEAAKRTIEQIERSFVK